ncbi:MAG: hypothetical protein HZB85_05745 [Deltaproteobacteria bacterium]|nr:hypothetical protein [Deltaproteobacteria bacterium]
MKSDPLLYFRTREQIAAYASMPVKDKFTWLEAQMKFFYLAMPALSKEIRDRFKADIRYLKRIGDEKA